MHSEYSDPLQMLGSRLVGRRGSWHRLSLRFERRSLSRHAERRSLRRPFDNCAVRGTKMQYFTCLMTNNVRKTTPSRFPGTWHMTCSARPYSMRSGTPKSEPSTIPSTWNGKRSRANAFMFPNVKTIRMASSFIGL